MSADRQAALFLALLVTMMSSILGTVFTIQVYQHQRTDNQVIVALHKENAALEQAYSETARALDETALRAARLAEENDRINKELAMHIRVWTL